MKELCDEPVIGIAILKIGHLPKSPTVRLRQTLFRSLLCVVIIERFIESGFSRTVFDVVEAPRKLCSAAISALCSYWRKRKITRNQIVDVGVRLSSDLNQAIYLYGAKCISVLLISRMLVDATRYLDQKAMTKAAHAHQMSLSA
ncbi:hypothetical protein Tco_1399962 [Tanacetum coccineum]